jgi:UDPglucose 6-dehydrogenase
MNDLSAFCEEVGADIENIRMGIGSDTRIGKRFLFAGAGYGGSCFPKDVRALIYSSEEVGAPLELVKSAQEVNYKQMDRFTNKILKRFDNNVKGKKIALWGLAFKNNTDDTRESPAFRIIELLLEHGALVNAFDPEAMDNTKIRFGDKISYSKDMYEALDGAEALVIATEWNDFRSPNFEKVRAGLKNPIIIDGRNLYDPQDMEEIEFEYHCIGRNPVNPGKYKV